ncbi:MAG: FAD/NAD(P)-binding protein, partial [Frankiales bacterium]|nr:FAD/NAD(P)-binding protein [Frankiales bacterium]
MTTVAVIGGGAAGALTVVQLARQWPREVPLRVVMYDASPRPARGLAYSTTEPHHLLNVPAGRMSAHGDDADHFLRWLRQRDEDVQPEDFVPRSSYGDYLADTIAECSSAIGLVVRRSRVNDVIQLGRKLRTVSDDGFDDV